MQRRNKRKKLNFKNRIACFYGACGSDIVKSGIVWRVDLAISFKYMQQKKPKPVLLFLG